MQTIKTKKKLKRDWVMIAQFLNIIYLASVHEVTHVNPVFLASVKPYPPHPPPLSPQTETEAREHLRKPDTNRVT